MTALLAIYIKINLTKLQWLWKKTQQNTSIEKKSLIFACFFLLCLWNIRLITFTFHKYYCISLIVKDMQIYPRTKFIVFMFSRIFPGRTYSLLNQYALIVAPKLQYKKGATTHPFLNCYILVYLIQILVYHACAFAQTHCTTILRHFLGSFTQLSFLFIFYNVKTANDRWLI